MGRRARNRARTSDSVAAAPRDRMARVRVDERTWREFRQAVGMQSIAERLGELVARDVAAHRRRQLRAGELDAHEVVDALTQARELSRDLDEITARLEAVAAAGAPSVAAPLAGPGRSGPLTVPSRVEER